MKIFGRKPTISAWIGIAIITFFILVAIFAPWIAPYGEAETVGDTWAPASAQFWLGTDNIGRDMVSRLIYGARMTIGVALMTTILSFLIGTIAGLFASIGGPVVDTVLSRAMIDGEVRSLYGKWFLSPIPPKGVNLGIPLSPLMRDQLTFPSDKVGDQLGG